VCTEDIPWYFWNDYANVATACFRLIAALPNNLQYQVIANQHDPTVSSDPRLRSVIVITAKQARQRGQN
jgi:hypothetical protein